MRVMSGCKAVQKRLREEFDNLQVELNEDKSRVVDLTRGECRISRL